MKLILVYFLTMIYNLSLIVGTVYLIEFHNWSPWWFCLTVLLMLYRDKGKKDEQPHSS